MLNGEYDSDERQIIVQIVHSEFQFPSLMPLAHFTSVTIVLILLQGEQIRRTLVRYRSISIPIFMGVIFTVLGDNAHVPVSCTYSCDVL
jgi:hypothetical protein